MDRGEVAAAAIERIAHKAEQHPESGADEHCSPDVEDRVLRRRKDEQQEPQEQTEPHAARRPGESRAAIRHLAGHALHGAQVAADNGHLLHRELGPREPVHDGHRFIVGVVGAQHIALRERRKRGAATRKWTLIAHGPILAPED